MANSNRFLAKHGLDNNSKTIINVSSPVNDTDAANKAFASNANNLTSGTIPGARLPSVVAFDLVMATNNGNGTNFKLGDDAWIGDINVANTFRISGAQDASKGYVTFGNADNSQLGRDGSGPLTWAGHVIMHTSNFGTWAVSLSGDQVINGTKSFAGTVLTNNSSMRMSQAFGTGTYTQFAEYLNSGGYSLEAPLSVENEGASGLPIMLTWRGGYGAKGGLRLTGGSSAELGGNAVLHSGMAEVLTSRSVVTTEDWNTITTAGVYRVANASGANRPDAYNYGNLTVMKNGEGVTQIYVTHSGYVFTRAKWNTADWQGWQHSINQNDIGSYAPSLTGAGASGTWNINVNGSAKRVVGTDNSYANALLQSGAERTDDAAGSTWLFADSRGSDNNKWGIRHAQDTNALEFWGNNKIQFNFDIWNGKLETYGDFALVSQDSGTDQNWRGRIGTKNVAADRSVFLGTYNGKSVVASHNHALGAWTEMYLNTISGTDGSLVHANAIKVYSGATVQNGLTMGTRVASVGYGGNNAGMELYDGVGEVRSNGKRPGLMWHYENVATRWLALEADGAMNFVSPTGEPSAVLRVQGRDVVVGSSHANTPTTHNFAIGFDGSANFIQSHAGKPLSINPLGNAVTINGQSPLLANDASSGVAGNRLVRRDENGYIFANHINFSTGVEDPTIANFFTDNGDGWSRKSSIAHVKNSIRNIADGTWGISVTGTANALSNNQTTWENFSSKDNVVGMLSWRNYGNNHVIFDASKGVSPSGTAIDNTNPAASWSGTYPTLMGWNGSQTYGVRVDSSARADMVNWQSNESGNVVLDANRTF